MFNYLKNIMSIIYSRFIRKCNILNRILIKIFKAKYRLKNATKVYFFRGIDDFYFADQTIFNCLASWQLNLLVASEVSLNELACMTSSLQPDYSLRSSRHRIAYLCETYIISGRERSSSTASPFWDLLIINNPSSVSRVFSRPLSGARSIGQDILSTRLLSRRVRLSDLLQGDSYIAAHA